MSSINAAAIGVIFAGLFILHGDSSYVRTANQLQAVSAATPVETIFPEPTPIQWYGHISRIFVSGSGLEVVSPHSPGGIFQAYMPGEEVSPITEGDVIIEGLWRGYTCAYGGHQGVCVPEVDIQAIQELPAEGE